MGFSNLQVTVSRSASIANISTTTRPSSAFPSVPAISTRGWWKTRDSSWCAALIGRQGTVQTSKKGCRSTPEFWFGTLNPLIRYQDFTPQSSSSDPPTGMRRIAFLPSLISNSAPGSSSSMEVYALPTRRLPLPCTFAV